MIRVSTGDLDSQGDINLAVNVLVPPNPPIGEPTDILAQLDVVKSLLEQLNVVEAEAILDRLEKDYLSRFTPFVSFRFFANRGHAQQFRGNLTKAAQFFLRAHQYCPELEKAGILEVLAYNFLGQHERARQAADALRDRFPASPGVIGLWIQTQPLTQSFENIESAVPEHLRDDGEVALGLTHCAGVRGQFKHAAFYAKRALDANPKSGGMKYHWVVSLLMHNRELAPEERDTPSLKEARSILQERISSVRHYATPQERAGDYINLAAAQRLLGETAAAEEAIAAAFALAPEDEDVRIQQAYVHLEHRELDAAIRLVEANLKDAPLRRRLVWAQMVLGRARGGDLHNAIGILSDSSVSLVGEPTQLRRAWFCTLIECFISCRRLDDAEGLLATDTTENGLTAVSRKTFLARVAIVRGDKTRATTLATEAMSGIGADTQPDELRDLASTLGELDLKRTQLSVVKRLVNGSSPFPLILNALRLAFNEDDEDYVLQLGSELRSRGRYNLQAIEAEIAVLQRISPQREAAFLMDVISECPDEAVTRHLRVIATNLGVDLKRPELIEADPAKLPQLDQVDEYQCERCVMALRQTLEPIRAVEMGYNLVRKFPNSLHSHQSVIFSVLPVGGPPQNIPQISEIEPGAAVLLHDEKAKKDLWYVLEPTDNPLAILNEISSDGKTARALRGLKVGDLVDLEEAFGAKRRVEIKAVVHRFVYRYQDCMEHLASRFPEQQLFKQFTVRDDVPPNRKFDEMFQFMEDAEKSNQDAVKDYGIHPMPLHLLARRMGRSMLQAIEAAITAEHGFLRCCQGSPDEGATAEAWINQASKVVIDETAFLTWFYLDEMFSIEIIDQVRGWDVEKFVAERTYDNLRKMQNDLAAGNDRLGVVRAGHTIVPRITPGFTFERASRNLKKILDFIQSNCVTVPGSTLGGLNPEAREDLLRLCGRAAAESAHLASKSALLWTDDFATAVLASHHLQCRRIWTQITARKICDPGIAQRLSLALVSMRYEFTSLSPDDVVNAVELAQWECNAWPLRDVLGYFGRRTPNLDGLLRLATVLLLHIWSQPIRELQSRDITWRLLDHLGSREDGRAAVQSLLLTTAQMFGINVLVADRLERVMRNWQAGQANPLIIKPEPQRS